MSTSPIPQVREDDPEDVSWALSTAATQWARGDRVEALKWLRRAAESASESDKDARALELAKAAAELTTPSMPPPSTPSVPPSPASRPAPPSRPGPPPLPPPSVRPIAQPTTPKTPPASVPPQKQLAHTPKAPTARPSTPPRPAAGVPAKRQSVRPPAGDTGKRAAHKSKPDATAKHAKPSAEEKTDIITEVTKTEAKAPVHTSEADAWPTESMGAKELDTLHAHETYGEERTRIGAPAYKASEPPAPPFRASQAVHVIIWRDADGKLRVAPRGTAVSAVTIEALLVAPSSDVDLLAWLGPT